MPTFEEMTTWDEDQIQAEILVLLPPGHRFEFGVEGGAWCARIHGPTGVVWEDFHYEARVILFNAFGWLWKPPEAARSSAWYPRARPRLVPVYQGPRPGIEDPADLDPHEIETVYEGDTKR